VATTNKAKMAHLVNIQLYETVWSY